MGECGESDESGAARVSESLEMESNQALVLISSGLLSVGLATIAAGGLAFRGLSKKTVGDVTKKHSVPWSPGDFLGGGSGGSSPIFGLMWTVIYAWCAVCIVCTLLAGLGRQNAHSSQTLCWACLFCFLSLLFASFWNIIFVQGKGWSFVASSVILFVVTVSMGIAAYLVNPFVHKNMSWFENVTGLFFAFFFGWTLVAFAVSLGTVTRFYNRGESRLDEDESSWWPFSLGVLVLVLSCALTNGFLSVPLLIASLFFRGYTKRWQVWSSTLLALAGVAVGIVLMLIRRNV